MAYFSFSPAVVVGFSREDVELAEVLIKQVVPALTNLLWYTRLTYSATPSRAGPSAMSVTPMRQTPLAAYCRGTITGNVKFKLLLDPKGIVISA